MAKVTAGLVPITRSFLAKFYEKYPLDPLPDEVDQLLERLKSLCETADVERKKLPGEADTDLLGQLLIPEIPHKLDQNFWNNREQLEEMISLCDKANWPPGLKASEDGHKALVEAIGKWEAELKRLLDFVSDYQRKTSEKISSMVLTYLPQDFRGTLFKQMKDRSERRREVEVATLIANGGTIRQKYALLWQQQMDRRTSLASLGAATGMYRTLVTYLAGVPQVLLDFVKTINDHNGPMEEQRIRYGPHIYALTKLVNQLRAFLALWWATFDTSALNEADAIGLVTDSLGVYAVEIEKFLNKVHETFEKAPFLISADEAMSEEEKRKAAEDFKEETISYGVSLTVPVTVEIDGSVVAWDFSLTYGKDIGFSVEYVTVDGTKTGVYPYARVESNEGSFTAPGVGTYNLIFDNAYSYMTKKTLRYKIGVIPPIETKEQVAAEEALTHPEATADAAPADA